MMTEQEYRAAEGLNYSLIASFAESPDIALMPVDQKEYFITGHAFERLLEDTVTGSSFFSERFFVSDVTGKMPDELSTWVKDGTLEDQYEYNKDGVTLNGKKKTKHGYIDACIQNPGLLPISTDLMAQLNTMVDNTLKCEFMGLPMGEILSDAEFQLPIFWEKDGIKKKALVDCKAELLIDEVPVTVIIDLKSTAQMNRFRYMVSGRYIWQDLHYIEGAMANYDNVLPQMVFVATSKQEPYLSKCFRVKDQSRDAIMEKYNQLCVDCSEWIEAGKPAKGWIEEEQLTIFI